MVAFLLGVTGAQQKRLPGGVTGGLGAGPALYAVVMSLPMMSKVVGRVGSSAAHRASGESHGVRECDIVRAMYLVCPQFLTQSP